MPPTLTDVVRPALESLRSRWLKYLRTRVGDADKVALDIARNPPRMLGMQERDLAQFRLATVRTSKVATTVEHCLLLFLGRHQGCNLILNGLPPAVSFVLERPCDRIAAIVQSRSNSENQGTQQSASQRQLLAQRSQTKTTHLARLFIAEYGIDSEHWLDEQHDIHHVNSQLTFHWASGDPGCWDQLNVSIAQLMRARDIRQAELAYMTAVEHALIGVSDQRISRENYERSRYRLEQAFGPCAPVLMESEPATRPRTVLDDWAEEEEREREAQERAEQDGGGQR